MRQVQPSADRQHHFIHRLELETLLAEGPSRGVGTANHVPWHWQPQSWRGPQRKRSWRPLGRSRQRAGVRPNVGGGCGDLVPPPFILECSRSLPVLDRPRLCFYKGRLFRAVFSALLHGCCTRAGPCLGSLIVGATKVLQSSAFNKWAMLGSNQRPLPCKVRSRMS
jgi:hypothetical protein